MKKIVSTLLFIIFSLMVVSCQGFQSMPKGDTGIDVEGVVEPAADKNKKKGK